MVSCGIIIPVYGRAMSKPSSCKTLLRCIVAYILMFFPAALSAQDLGIYMFDQSDVKICPAQNDDQSPPDFHGAQCQKMHIDKVDPQGDLIWIKVNINMPKTHQSNDRPLALYVSGKMSSRAYLNGQLLGSNGVPSAAPSSETIGQMDTQFYAPQDLFRQGDNEVILLASSHHGYLKLYRPIHMIAIGPANIVANNLLPTFSPALMTLGLFIMGFLYFAIIGFLGSSRTRSWTFSSICFFAAAQLFSETSRGLFQYNYPLHDIRIIAIAIFSAGFGLSTAFHIFKTFYKGNIIYPMVMMTALSLLGLIFGVGYDYKSLLAMIIPLIFAVSACGYWSYHRKERAFLYFITLLIFIGGIFMFQASFLDTIFFFLIAFFLLLLFIEQALTLSDEEKQRRIEEARADRLENALTQAKERDDASEIIVKSAGKVEHIPTKNIVHCSGASGYAEIHLLSGRSILHSITLNEMEDILPSIFLRVHRSHMVNVIFVKSLQRDPAGTGTLSLTDGSEVPVSRRIMPKVRKALG